MESKYKISFNYTDLSFEIESTNLHWIEEKTKSLFEKIETLKNNSLSNTPTKAKNVGNNVDTSAISQLSVTEFYQVYIKKNNISTRTEIALFFIYYLEKVQKKSDIKTSDVAICFKEIGYPNYSQINFTDVLHQNRKKGLLNNVNGFWSLTITAMDFIFNVITSVEDE
jgi:hypothetical protein